MSVDLICHLPLEKENNWTSVNTFFSVILISEPVQTHFIFLILILLKVTFHHHKFCNAITIKQQLNKCKQDHKHTSLVPFSCRPSCQSGPKALPSLSDAALSFFSLPDDREMENIRFSIHTSLPAEFRPTIMNQEEYDLVTKRGGETCNKPGKVMQNPKHH